jgi:hypothetical protein
MPTFVLLLFRCARLLFSGHAAVAAENAALHLQLAAFQRQRRRPVLTSLDRLFWVGLSLMWKRWRPPLMYVRADTVVRWQRARFRRFLGTFIEKEPASPRQTRVNSEIKCESPWAICERSTDRRSNADKDAGLATLTLYP